MLSTVKPSLRTTHALTQPSTSRGDCAGFSRHFQPVCRFLFYQMWLQFYLKHTPKKMEPGPCTDPVPISKEKP